MVIRLLKKTLLLLACLFSLSASFAQNGNYIGGYAYLGTCTVAGQPHYYYVSTTARTWPVAKDSATRLNGYLATLTSSEENNCVYNNYRTYLMRPGGPGLVPKTNSGCSGSLVSCSPWNDDRHPWIGYTDAGSEGTWNWANGENCNNFSNWDVREPNNYVVTDPPETNGEDYAQLLAFESLPITDNQQAGKWNDWFNTESQWYIVEFGPNPCAPPPPPVMRGNDGCSHGYWKNSKDKSWTDAGYMRTASFMTTFGITNNRNVVTGSTTLQQSLELNGGGYNQVAKQGTAALLNASRGFFPYTTTEIHDAVMSMFNTGTAMLPSVTVNGTTYTGGTFTTANALASYLDMLNNLGCPLNNAGMMGSISARETPITEAAAGLTIRALANPAHGAFNLQIGSASAEKATLRVMDMQGKLIEQRSNMSANQNLIFGNAYRPGVYFIEVMQGAERKQLKLVKAN